MTSAAVGRFERFTVLMMHRAPVAFHLLPGKMLFCILVAVLENAVNFCCSPMDTNALVYLMGKPLPCTQGPQAQQPARALLQASLERGLQRCSLLLQPVPCGCSACGTACPPSGA